MRLLSGPRPLLLAGAVTLGLVALQVGIEALVDQAEGLAPGGQARIVARATDKCQRRSTGCSVSVGTEDLGAKHRLVQRELTVELLDGRGAVAQTGKDRPAGWIREGRERQGESVGCHIEPSG